MKKLLLSLLFTLFAASGFAQQKAGEAVAASELTWTAESKKEMSGLLSAHFASNLLKVKVKIEEGKMQLLAACVVEKVAAAYSPAEMEQVPDGILDTFINKAAKKCNEDLKLGID
jgi:hypothetical protein